MDRVSKQYSGEKNPKGTSEETQSQERQEDELNPEDLFDMGLFGNIAQIFLNPSELQKQIEAQLEDIMSQMEAGTQDGPLRDEEINKEEFKRLLDSKKGPFISSSPAALAKGLGKPKNKISDDERVMDMIHGTTPEEENTSVFNKRNAVAPFVPPGHPRIDIWTPVLPPGGANGRQIFQGVITTTVRRPDGVSGRGRRKVLEDRKVYFVSSLSRPPRRRKSFMTRTAIRRPPFRR